MKKAWSSCWFKCIYYALMGVIVIGGVWMFDLADIFSAVTPINIHSYEVSTPEEYQRTIPGLKYGKSQPPPVPQEPVYFHLKDLLGRWNPDHTAAEKWVSSPAHPNGGQGVARLNYSNPDDVNMASLYSKEGIPFIYFNVPPLDHASAEWTLPFLHEQMGSTPRLVEQSTRGNKFIYFKLQSFFLDAGANLRGLATISHALAKDVFSAMADGWRPPQVLHPMSFMKFIRKVAQAEKYESAGDRTLQYMVMSAREGASTDWVRRALWFFGPTSDASQSSATGIRSSAREKQIDAQMRLARKAFPFSGDGRGGEKAAPSQIWKGINCRFGMRGVVAAAHFDGHANYVAMVRGRKRYVRHVISLLPHVSLSSCLPVYMCPCVLVYRCILPTHRHAHSLHYH
jgi:hypothetical protein